MSRLSVLVLLLSFTIVPWNQFATAALPTDDALVTIPAGTATYYVVICRNFAAIPPADPIAVQEGNLVSDCTNSGIYQESNGVPGAQIYSAADASYAGDAGVLVA